MITAWSKAIRVLLLFIFALQCVYSTSGIAQTLGLATRIKSGTATPSGTCNSGGGNTDFFIQTSIGEYWCDAGTWRLSPASTMALYANDTSTGTTANKLAELTGAPSTAILAAHTNTSGLLGVVVKNAGTSGTATVQLRGQVSCVFDGATTAGHYVTRSATVDGDCTDAGTSPASENVGRVLSTNGAGGTYIVELFGPSMGAGSSSSVTINTTSPLGGGGTGSTFTLTCTGCLTSVTAHNLLSATHGDTTAASAVRGDGIFAIGTTPTWQRLAHPSTTGGYFKWNGTDVVASSGAASGTGACGSHNWVSTLNADASPTCTQPALADITAIAADSVAQNASGSSAAPTAVAIPNCSSDGAHALVYSTSTHGWTCSSITGGSGVAVQPVVAKSAGYTVTTSDFSSLTAFIFTCTGACDVTLPASAPTTNGQFVSIKNQGTNSIFVMPNGLNLDSSIAPLLIPPKYTATIWTDTANYFSASVAAVGEHSSRRFAAIQAGNATLVAIGNSITTTANGALTATAATSTEGFFEAMTTSTSSSSVADTVELGGLWGIASTASNARWSARFGMDDGSAGVTNIRALLGFYDTAGTSSAVFGASSSDSPSQNELLFRCSSNASDTNWMALVGKNGSGVTTASTGVACDTSNHTFAIQEHGGNTAYFYIDGVFKVCIGSDTGCTSAASKYPAFAAARSIAGITTLNAAQKTAHFFWMQAESDR